MRSIQSRLGRAAADSELEPAAGNQIGRAGVLGHVQRVLVAHVDHGGPDLDPRRAGADRREQRERGGELTREVMDPEVRAVDPERLSGLGQLNRLVQRLVRGARARPRRVLPVAK